MEKETISAIKKRLASNDFTPDIWEFWCQDKRQGVQKLLKSYQSKQTKMAEKETAFLKRKAFERRLLKEGYHYVAGIDEVGRGPLAGPVVAAAVILPEDFHQVDVNDSKQLSEKRREELYSIIMEQALAVGIGIQSEQVIDEVNIYQATKLAMIESINNLCLKPDYLLLDAMTLDVDYPQESLIKGDAKSISIAAASIVAKVIRDKMMKEYDQLYPGYGFAKNAGYGTKDHLTGLEKMGPTPIHRKTFAPVKNYFE